MSSFTQAALPPDESTGKSGAVLRLCDVSIRVGRRLVFPHLTWEIERGHQWAVVGPNGSGKSALLAAINGRLPTVGGRVWYHSEDGARVTPYPAPETIPRRAIVDVSDAEQEGLMASASAYYQARWHSSEADRALTVRDLLSPQRLFGVSPFQVVGLEDVPVGHEQAREQAVSMLGIGEFLDRKLLHLSNGERRKVMLARGVAMCPRILILDDPFAGLDARYREHLGEVIEELMASGMSVIAATTRLDEVPRAATHLLVVRDGTVVRSGEKGAVLAECPVADTPPLPPPRKGGRLPPGRPSVDRGDVREDSPGALVQMEHVCVRYGERDVLRDVSWTVRPGEHWALLGANGAGKSTLLSILSADNPQAYANCVTVLGWTPNGGMNVREMRRRIGWVSPEMQLHYRTSRSCLDVVCSGYFGSVGLFQQPTPEQRCAADERLSRLGMHEVAERPFDGVSDGARRMVLLARALVAHPRLLILDEPCQGVDGRHRRLVLESVDRAAETECLAVVFVTHHHDELPSCITNTLRLDDGRVVD